jgi:hypothetical protein
MSELTFAVQLDFFIAHERAPAGRQQSPDCPDETLREIAALLKSAGIDAISSSDIYEVEQKRAQMEIQNDVNKYNARQRRHWPKSIGFAGTLLAEDLSDNSPQQWQIRHPSLWGSFKGPEEDKHYFKVTLLTPLLPRNQDSIQSIQKVCQLITDEFLTAVNEGSCQFNVYIVKGQNGFTEQIIKNMLGLIWTFESSIDTMHGKNQDRELRQSMHGFHHRYLTESKALEEILAATAIEAIDLCFHPDIWGGQKYDALDFRGGTPSRMPRMKFEQHVATMDGDDIEHWIKACWGIIDFAERTDPGALAFLRSHIGAAEIVPAEILLKELGLPEQAEFYAKKIQDKPKPKNKKRPNKKKPKFAWDSHSEYAEAEMAYHYLETAAKKEGKMKNNRKNGKKGLINQFGLFAVSGGRALY